MSRVSGAAKMAPTNLTHLTLGLHLGEIFAGIEPTATTPHATTHAQTPKTKMLRPVIITQTEIILAGFEIFLNRFKINQNIFKVLSDDVFILNDTELLRLSQYLSRQTTAQLTPIDE